MKRLLLVFAGVMLVACSKEEPPPEPVRPVLSIKVQALDEENLGRFAGSIQARYESNIGFRVPGRIASRNVDVGAEVEKGALLATLDPTDQQNQLRSAEGDLAQRPGAVHQCPGQRPAPAGTVRSRGRLRRRNWTSPRPI